MLPILFDLLYENMDKIAPGEGTYSEQKETWVSEVSFALRRPSRQILMFCHLGEPVGFVMYYFRSGMLMVEELQLKRSVQRSLAFLSCCRSMCYLISEGVETLEAYADRRNLASIRMMQKLGMTVLDDGEGTPFVHFRGDYQTVKKHFVHDR